MHASTQPVLHRAAAPIVAAAGFTGEDCRIGRRYATGSLLQAHGISIADAKSCVVEADHHE
ncbi:MAG: hypothetical protein ACLPM3_15760 [Terracidiphilus sp.]